MKELFIVRDERGALFGAHETYELARKYLCIPVGSDAKHNEYVFPNGWKIQRYVLAE